MDRIYTFGPAGHLELFEAGANEIAFTSDHASRLSKIERLPDTPNGDTANLLYDGRSLLARAEQPVGEGVDLGFVEPTYSSDGVLHALRRQLFQAEHVEELSVFYFAGRPVAQLKEVDGTGEWTFLTTDHLGTPLLATDAAGFDVWAGPFEPFGEDTFGQALDSDVFLRLPGQWADRIWEGASLGADVYYNVHRWYESGTGRYARTDPLRLTDPADVYRFALSNPLVNVDRRGLRPDRPQDRIPDGGQPCSALESGDPPECCDKSKTTQALRNVKQRAASYCAKADNPTLPFDDTDRGGGPLPQPWFRDQGDECVNRCICDHERCHWSQVTTGVRAGWSTNQLECEAYRRQVVCLTLAPAL